jgi:hypothetical protein
VAEDDGLGDAGGRGDLLRGGAAEAALREQTHRHVNDLPAAVFAGHAPGGRGDWGGGGRAGFLWVSGHLKNHVSGAVWILKVSTYLPQYGSPVKRVSNISEGARTARAGYVLFPTLC